MMDTKELERSKLLVREAFFEAGADYVIDNLSEIGELFYKINAKLAG
jgi:hypothetical protein